MCGIVGVWERNADKEMEKSKIERMLDIIKYRGPDDEGIFINRGLGLGHARLSIIDLSSNGRQPLITKDGKGVLTYNGELYNYKQLKGLLQKEGVEFTGESDSEVFLYALYTWGVEKAIRKMEGMFAFAYFDMRTEILWLGRDRMGIKPIYLIQKDDTIIFASEIKALFEYPKVECKPNMIALATYFTHDYLEGKWTTFENVESVLPGCIIKISKRNVKEYQYYDVIDNIDVDAINEASKNRPDLYVDLFEKRIRSSVNSHLMGDVPVATFCSGGVDSSLITAYAKQNVNSLTAYVANVEDALPEYKKALSVGQWLGVHVKTVDYSTKEYLLDWPKSIWYNDIPPVYRSDQAFLKLAKECRKDGIKVVLTGEGADELFGGYEWHEDAYKLWHYRKIFSGISQSSPESLRWHIGNKALFDRFLAFITPIDHTSLIQRTFARYPAPNPYYEHKVLRNACAEDGGQRLFRYHKLFEKLSGVKKIEERALLAICFDDMYGHLLNLLQRNDRMGMAASIESRIPFLDNGMVDLAMILSAKCRYYRGERKWIVKEVASRKLPREIVYAPKLGFSTSKKQYKYALPLIRDGLVPQMFHWSTKEMDFIFSELNRNRYVLYSIVGAELWARIFLNKENTEELGEKLVYNYEHNIS